MAAALAGRARWPAAIDAGARPIWPGGCATGGKLLVFGNGGSAADAQHVAAEFTGRYLLDRPPLPAIALADERRLGDGDRQRLRLRSGVRAAGACVRRLRRRRYRALHQRRAPQTCSRACAPPREAGLLTIGVTGAGGEPMRAELCDHLVTIPAEQTPQIQEGTMLVLHTLCELVEHRLFGG